MKRFWRKLLVGGTALVTASTALVGAAGTAGAKQPHGAPITIGFVCSCTGSAEASSTALSEPAFRAWASHVNAHGGIDGHKVKVHFVDDTFNPGTSLAEVERLVSDDHVAAIVDSSYEDASWATYVKEHRVPVIGALADELFLTNPYFFSAGQTLDAFITGTVLAAKKVGAKSLSQFYCAESVTCQNGVATLRTAAKSLHVALPYVASVSASAPNYSAQCLAAKQAGVEAIIVADASSVVKHVAGDCAAQGYHPWIIAGSGAVSTSFAHTPGLNDHFIGTEPVIPFFVHSTKATKTFRRALAKYQPSVLKSPDFGETVIQTWVGGLLIEAAAKAGKVGAHGQSGPARMLKGLYSLHDETLGGMAPPLNFKKGVPNPVDCWYWIRIQHDEFTTPYGVKATCSKPATS